MSGYHQGRRVEWWWMHHLTDNGYECTRAASSKGVADVIAIKQGQVLLINVKRTSMPPPHERRELVRVARLLPGVAVPAIARGRRLFHITDDGTNPKRVVPFLIDEVTE